MTAEGIYPKANACEGARSDLAAVDLDRATRLLDRVVANEPYLVEVRWYMVCLVNNKNSSVLAWTELLILGGLAI